MYRTAAKRARKYQTSIMVKLYYTAIYILYIYIYIIYI